MEVKALTDGKGVDVVLDAVGGPMFEPSLKSLRVGGRQVAIASIGNGRVEFSLVDFYHNLHRLIGVDTIKLTGPEIQDHGRPLRGAICDRRPFRHGRWTEASTPTRRLRRERREKSTSFYLGEVNAVMTMQPRDFPSCGPRRASLTKITQRRHCRRRSTNFMSKGVEP
jgi:hypothetical protein